VAQRQLPASHSRATAASAAAATDGRARSLWFDPPTDDQDRRPRLTRERVVAEALAVIAQDGIQALTMRSLAARLGVVPGAVYHHVRNKQQLQDLVLDNVLAEVDVHLDHALGWTDQLKVLAHRLRQVLEQHPGVARILKSRDPLGPHSLALAEAFLEPLQAAGFGERDAGLAFFLLVDYTVGFAVSDTSATQQPEPSCTSSSAPFPPTSSPPWSPWANTYGSTTATSGSPPGCMCWSMGWSTRATPPATTPEHRLPAQPGQPSRAQCLANLTAGLRGNHGRIR